MIGHPPAFPIDALLWRARPKQRFSKPSIGNPRLLLNSHQMRGINGPPTEQPRTVRGTTDALVKQVAAENPGTVSGVLRSRRAKDGL